MIVLYFADIFGKPGRRAVAAALPELVANYSPDLIIGNAENLAGGRGVNRRVWQEMMNLGFHGMTSGNHIWDNREVLTILDHDERLLRPANYPSPEHDRCPGKGFGVFRNGNKSLFVINVMGRVFMDPLECPFATVDKILKENPTGFPILVDLHADATSEKAAMGWHLNGRVAAVVGSHSHIQSADERVLPGGTTAFITDVGMTGAFDSCIGMRPQEVLKKFLTKRHSPYQPAKENPGVSCVIIRIAPNNKAQSIERLRFTVDLKGSPFEHEGDME